jgi:hypothetical protein
MKFAMSDGRIFTDYQPNCSLNSFIQNKYAPNSNEHEFRYALQRNADKIIKDMNSFEGTACKLCPVCKESLKVGGANSLSFGFLQKTNKLT